MRTYLQNKKPYSAAKPGLLKVAGLWASTQMHTLSEQAIAAAFCSCYAFYTLQTAGASLVVDNMAELSSKASSFVWERSCSLFGEMKIDQGHS